MMSTSNQSKKSRNHDYITDMPECIMSNILSRLSTKEAVRTSVLSKAWEHKWTSIHRIEIDNHVDYDSRTMERNPDKVPFINFMNRIFLLPRYITSFYLHLSDEYGRADLESWIRRVFIRKVQKVAMVIEPSIDDDSFTSDRYPFDISFPSSLVTNCISLRELKVQMMCTFKVANNIRFTNLTSLSLSIVHILNDNFSTKRLTFTFPVLVELEIRNCSWSYVKFVDIFAPALRTFTYETIIDEMDDYFKIDVDQFRIKIHGVSLTRFKSCGWYQENIHFAGSRVDYADIKIIDTKHIEPGGLRIRRLIKELSGLRILELSGFVAQALAVTKSVRPLPTLDTLRQIVLSGIAPFEVRASNIEGLFELLHKSPFLSVLVIDMVCVIFMDCPNGYDYEAVELPSCVASQLKIVKLENFGNKLPHLHLAMYLLKNAAQLRRVLLSTQRGNGKEEIWEKLSDYPKASTSVIFGVI